MQKPLADIFTWPSEEPQLIGSRCDSCSAVTFPVQARCPRCGRSEMAELLLPRQGTLVAWTTQGFPPVVPYAGDETGKSFEPFGVGLVELDDVVRVESRLSESDPDKLRFGMDVELQVVPFYVDADGDEIMTFEFAPVAAGRDQS
ncbi:MAG TPA: Zn-ribbon domain-containing OB-fold protein [Acidimicrobiales bacterium]